MSSMTMNEKKELYQKVCYFVCKLKSFDKVMTDVIGEVVLAEV